jgi:tetratricopeptide (TPR) repeat protein
MKRQWVHFSAAAVALIGLSSLLVSCAGNPEKAKLKYLQKGQAYMKQAQYSSAAIEFRNALKVDPRYSEAYLQLAKADIALGDNLAAYQALEQGVTADPNRVDLHLARAEMLLTASDEAERAQAAADANFVLQRDAKNAEAHRILGSALFAQKQYDQAIQEYSKAAALAPNDPASYLGIAQVDNALHNTADTELNLQKAVQADPHTSVAYILLSELYAQQHRPDQTEQILQTGIKANPSSVPLYTALADFYAQQKEPSQAEEVLQTGIKTNPSYMPLYLGLAVLLERDGKQADAERVLSNLSAQMPKSPDAAIAIGDFYRAAKMNDRALTEYQKGLSANPQNVKIEESIEDLDLSIGQTDSAAKLDEGLLKQSPNDVTVRIFHGRVLMAQGKAPDAIQLLRSVTADAPSSPEAHFYLGAAYWQNGDLAQANNEFQQTLAQANTLKQRTGRTSPAAPEALGALVNLNFAQRNYSVAHLYAQELVEGNPSNAKSHLMLGEVLLKLNQVKQAGDQFAAAQTLAPDDPSIHIDFASLYGAQGKFSEEEKELQTALHAAPNNPAFVADYRDFLVSRNEEPKAHALVSEFLAQNPSQSDAHFLMGQIYMTEKNESAALSETQKAIQLNPKSENAYMQMGQIYRDQGNNDAAIQAYQQGMTLGPPSAPVVTTIGSIYQQEGDLPKASGEFQKALDIDPNFSIAANNLAWIYAEQGQNLDTALSLAQKAKSQQPNLPEFSDTLAWIMYRKGNYAGALPLLEDCVKKSPDSAQFHYHLGMVLIASGQKNQGKAQLQAALHMNLDSEDAAQARKSLSQ